MNARSSDLFSSDLWARALESYACDTHLSVKLFDADARLVFGPIHSTPLFQLFEDRGYDPGIFAECARRCLAQGDSRPAVMISEVCGLAVVGTSLLLEGRVVGAAVGGYALVDFSLLSDIQHLAKNAGIDFARLWQVAREQKPVPKQRLMLSGELLQVLGDALLRENHRTRQYEQTVLKLQEVVKAKDQAHDELQRVASALCESEQRLTAELEGARLLEQISTQLIQEDDLHALYRLILDAGTGIMRSEMASIQVIDESQDALRMLAWRGFDPGFGETYKLNCPDTKTSWVARRAGHRVVVPDVETCDFIAGTSALEDHRKTGIRAVQSTPLFSRSGPMVGMLSTYWRTPHQPAESDLRLFDILARQAADLIERKQAEEAATRLAAIVESSDDAIISKDLNGVITSWNAGAQRLFGYTAQEAIGRSVTMLIPPDRFNEEPGILERIRRGESIQDYETIRRRKDGTLLHISLSVSPIADSQGHIVGASKIARDISERKQAEEALKEADRRKNEFLAMVSHELRTPLNAIYGWATLLLAGEVSGEKMTNALAIIRRNAQDQVRLIEDLLDVSQIMTGQIKLKIESLDVASIVQEVLESIGPIAEAKGISLHRVLPARTAFISGDCARLEQVLKNLLANAVKFTPEGGRIEVRVEQDDSHIEITVTDTGQGIKAELLPYVFERFRQGDSSLTRRHGGLGLGLAIVREIVQLHGGSVIAESCGEGQGATFRVQLPRLVREETIRDVGSMRLQMQADRPPSFDCPPVLQGLRVLVVDDDEAALDLLETVFQKCGCEVKMAGSAEAGFAEIQAWTPHLIVADIGMPGTDGYAFIDRVRQYERPHHRMTPAIALTAYVRPEDRVRALSAGYQAHVAKPTDLMELTTVAASLVGAFAERQSA